MATYPRSGSSPSASGSTCERGASRGSPTASNVAAAQTATLAQPAPASPHAATMGVAEAVASRLRTSAPVSPAAITFRYDASRPRACRWS